MKTETALEKFDLVRLLSTVFDPVEGSKVAILIDLEDPRDVIDFEYLKDHRYSAQRHAFNDFYMPIKTSAAFTLNLKGGEFFAYKATGGSNLDLPDEAWTPEGKQVSLEADVYPNFNLILCISTYSATAPLTAFAKKYGFRGATMHGVNDIILGSGLCKDYNEVSAEAEKLRLGMTGADYFEIDFTYRGSKSTLKLITNGQEAQKSHGLCQGSTPDIANLPAGEVYFVPEGAEGEFPMVYEEDPNTIGLMRVSGGRINEALFLEGNPETIANHNMRLKSDPKTGEIGELGMGTQVLPVSGSDIQDEKIRGTVHVATGRSDHLGGNITPDQFKEAGNASHDDILFSPQKTPKINVTEVRMFRNGKTEILMQNFKTAPYMDSLLAE